MVHGSLLWTHNKYILFLRRGLLAVRRYEQEMRRFPEWQACFEPASTVLPFLLENGKPLSIAERQSCGEGQQRPEHS